MNGNECHRLGLIHCWNCAYFPHNELIKLLFCDFQNILLIYQWLIVSTESRRYMQATTVPTGIVTHEGSDVPIYATGPMSHLFHSTHEQHYIYHVMTYAACLDDRRQHCHRRTSSFRAPSPHSRQNEPTALRHAADRRFHTEVDYSLHGAAYFHYPTILSQSFMLLLLCLSQWATLFQGDTVAMNYRKWIAVNNVISLIRVTVWMWINVDDTRSLFYKKNTHNKT